MISHLQFGKLRLAQFLPSAEIAELVDWEYHEAYWLGEAIGFSEWLRLESDPEVLRSLAIAFDAFPADAAAAVLKMIDLPVHAGMTALELKALFGEPKKEYRFVDDRITYDFLIEGPPRYTISCTVLNEGGLSYLVVMRPFRKHRPE